MRPSQVLVSGISGPELTAEEIRLFRELQPGGFILFTRNLINPLQTRQLTDSLRKLSDHTPIIAIDNEGGRVWRTAAFTPSLPSASRLGQYGDSKLIARAGWATGRLLSLLGINLNLAPVLDLDHHPGNSNALNGRCWGLSDQDVINYAGVFNRWQRRQGIVGCAKHFPCGGRSTKDPHHALPIVETPKSEILRRDIIPYTALMPELDAIMISHIHFPLIDRDSLPASLSHNIIQGLLRDRLGFDHHLVLSDDLDMAAIRQTYGAADAACRAVMAGSDLVLLCHEFMDAEETVARLERLPDAIFYDIARRLEKLRRRLIAPPVFSSETFEAITRDLAAVNESLPSCDPDPGTEPPASSPVEEY